ncbi:MAG: aldose 1-epimerase family protein [Microthrixaceae bacterium]
MELLLFTEGVAMTVDSAKSLDDQTRVSPSGDQFEIRFEDQAATIVEVGGGVRTYTKGGRDVLNPYSIDQMCDGAHGTPLIPWPNRLADGRYNFDGQEHQVALTEPEKRNAIHGFLRWRSWVARDHTESAVTMCTRLHPLKGYPFALDIEVQYSLDSNGLTVSTTATNIGERPCPYGEGQHPYLSPGAGQIDDCVLRLDASTRVLTDDERQLPTGLEPVEGTPFDFRIPRRLGSLAIDHAFTDLIRDSDGRAWVHLTGTDGYTARMWVDRNHPLIQIYTADTLATDRGRSGLGTEPMTCPPNAFQTGESVIRLEPAESITTTWGAELLSPGESLG